MKRKEKLRFLMKLRFYTLPNVRVLRVADISLESFADRAAFDPWLTAQTLPRGVNHSINQQKWCHRSGKMHSIDYREFEPICIKPWTWKTGEFTRDYSNVSDYWHLMRFLGRKTQCVNSKKKEDCEIVICKKGEPCIALRERISKDRRHLHSHWRYQVDIDT